MVDAAGGVSWKAIWIEPFEVFVESGKTRPYAVKGIRLDHVTADITSAPELKVASADPDILDVDTQKHLLIGRKPGHTQVRISFSQITAIYEACVVAEQK